MSPQDYFPPHLLDQPAEVRLDYFIQKRVVHPLLSQAYEALRQAIRHPTGTSLIFVFGPTGVGKTTLGQRIEKLLITEAEPALLANPGRLPVVSLETLAPENGQFNWKDFYTRALLAADEPLVEAKIEYKVRGLQRNAQQQLVIREDVSTSRLRQAWEQCLAHRQPAAVLIDEAQHFQKVSKGRRLLDQMDVIKSLASLTRTVHVLIGTYELLNLLRLSAQLSRRSVEIHFPRYQLHDQPELKVFINILWTFQRHLPLPQETDLVGHYDYFYERSAGCVGLLKDWLNRALAAALQDDQKLLTSSYLERHALLRTLLGMECVSSSVPSPSTSPKQVAHRKPVRDQVGSKG